MKSASVQQITFLLFPGSEYGMEQVPSPNKRPYGMYGPWLHEIQNFQPNKKSKSLGGRKDKLNLLRHGNPQSYNVAYNEKRLKMNTLKSFLEQLRAQANQLGLTQAILRK